MCVSKVIENKLLCLSLAILPYSTQQIFDELYLGCFMCITAFMIHQPDWRCMDCGHLLERTGI